VSSRAGLRVIVALAAAVAGAGALSLFRPGYSPDEEFTLFAVRGIDAHGLPLLPSGLLYDRGLVYSYLSWLSAALAGVELPAFRALSLSSGAGVLVLGYALVRTGASTTAGVAAALLVATSVPFWAVVTTGRFYAPFLLTCVAVLVVVARLRSPGTDAGAGAHASRPGAPARTWLALAVLAFLSRLTHELAFTLMAIPVAGLLLDSGSDAVQSPGQLRPLRHLRTPRHLPLWVAVAVGIGVGLVAAQAVLFALHYAPPAIGRGSGGDTMIQRFFVWQVLNLFERPRGVPLGVVLSALVVAWLLAPWSAVRGLKVAAAGAVSVLAIAVALEAASAPLPAALVRDVVSGALAYPLDMFWHLAGAYPVMVWTALTLLVARLCGAGGAWHAGERAAHLGWVGWVLWFGVIESGITINYVLLPTVCMLAAIGIDLVAIGQHAAALRPGRLGQVAHAALTAAGLLVVAGQWPRSSPVPARLASARPTIALAGIDGIREELRPTDRVACTDELACLVLVGRVDAWLALDDYVRERFVVRRGAAPVGVYTGAPAVFRPVALFQPGPGGVPPGRVIVVDVFKEHPVGHSSTWLPRALEADRLASRTLLLTGQARIVEVVNESP